eukprot:5015826-Alexandrium_andersonii.AAC.1
MQPKPTASKKALPLNQPPASPPASPPPGRPPSRAVGARPSRLEEAAGRPSERQGMKRVTRVTQSTDLGRR